MEDAHVTELSLDGTSRNPSNAFFAVYDGHCGDSVAHFAANRLHRCLRELEPYKKEHYIDALIKAFLKTDEAIYQGIWDVLMPQQAVGAVKALIAQGKTLKETSEAICELCLAPDLSNGPIGTDNMTIIIVAILRGRTVDEWYKHVSAGVKGETPAVSLPSPFSQSRLAAFRTKRAKMEARRG
ncbi:hypothetical protein EIP86_003345 [Pleurotus ostreatoroseus]|nr:hypothetical protein EIP86_003345 [Pleurotus ostreatoroseus]